MDGANLATIHVASNHSTTQLMQENADMGAGRRDFYLCIDDKYSHTGAYKDYTASQASDTIYTECGGATGGGIALSWHGRQARVFAPLNGETPYDTAVDMTKQHRTRPAAHRVVGW
jgi:hypothetical protein